MARHWDPVRDLMTLQERMNHLFEDAAQRRSRTDEEGAAEIERADWIPAADVYETESDYTIVLDLPGIRREGLDVGLDDSRLTIRGERAPAVSEAATMRRAERPSGRFARSFSLPDVVDRQAITADYKDGVLQLRLPKRTEQQSRRVKIEIQ
jgi:HSP20 family protein